MVIPPGYTEQSVLAAVEKCAAILAPKFVFGSYDLDDIRQQCHIFAIEVLEKEKFDPRRPLENFLYRHLKNQLINFKRNKFRRTDPPCHFCAGGQACPEAGVGYCAKYSQWLERNKNKANIASPLGLDNVCVERETRARADSSVETEAEIGELLAKIDAELPVELRATYLQMRAGVSVPKTSRLKVERAVKDILSGVIEECPSEAD